MRSRRSSSSSRRPWRCASASSATHSVAVRNSTRWPARQARIPSAIARCVLPVPGGPSRTTFSLACRKSSWPRCSITCFLMRALEGEVELLERLAGGEPCGSDPRLAAVRRPGRRSRSTAALRRTAHSSIPLSAGALGELRQRPGGRRGLHRPEQVRELGGGAHAISRVIDGERALLDERLVRAVVAVLAVALPERPGVLQRGDRAVLGEAALVRQRARRCPARPR